MDRRNGELQRKIENTQSIRQAAKWCQPNAERARRRVFDAAGTRGVRRELFPEREQLRKLVKGVELKEIIQKLQICRTNLSCRILQVRSREQAIEKQLIN